MKRSNSSLFLFLLATGCLLCFAASAHDGGRELASTLQFDDPDIEDELVLPRIQGFKEHDDGGNGWSTEYSAEFSKRITRDFAIGIEGEYVDQSEDAGGGNGFGNASLSAKYNLLDNKQSESKVTAGFEWNIGGTGSSNIGSDDYSTLQPQIFFAQGLGNVGPRWAKPLAVTGAVGLTIPTDDFSDETDEATGMTTRTRNQTEIDYGFSIQYDLPYLHEKLGGNVAAPFKNIIPLVEFAFETPLDGAEKTTRITANPGFSYMGDGYEITAEALIPLNGQTGQGVGFTAQAKFDLEYLLPHSAIGRPIF